jgi:hypothetical protein
MPLPVVVEAAPWACRQGGQHQEATARCGWMSLITLPIAQSQCAICFIEQCRGEQEVRGELAVCVCGQQQYFMGHPTGRHGRKVDQLAAS